MCKSSLLGVRGGKERDTVARTRLRPALLSKELGRETCSSRIRERRRAKAGSCRAVACGTWQVRVTVTAGTAGIGVPCPKSWPAGMIRGLNGVGGWHPNSLQHHSPR